MPSLLNGGVPVLLANHAGRGRHWVGLRLGGTTANRDGVGATITWSAGGTTRSRVKNAGGSYMSAHDPRDVLGLAEATGVDWVEVRWPAPSRRRERFHRLPSDRYTTVVEGTGTPVSD